MYFEANAEKIYKTNNQTITTIFIVLISTCFDEYKQQYVQNNSNVLPNEQSDTYGRTHERCSVQILSTVSKYVSLLTRERNNKNTQMIFVTHRVIRKPSKY